MKVGKFIKKMWMYDESDFIRRGGDDECYGYINIYDKDYAPIVTGVSIENWRTYIDTGIRNLTVNTFNFTAFKENACLNIRTNEKYAKDGTVNLIVSVDNYLEFSMKRLVLKLIHELAKVCSFSETEEYNNYEIKVPNSLEEFFFKLNDIAWKVKYNKEAK